VCVCVDCFCSLIFLRYVFQQKQTSNDLKVIEGYYQHLCRPTTVQTLNQTSSAGSASIPSAATHARAVAAGEVSNVFGVLVPVYFQVYLYFITWVGVLMFAA